MSPHLQYSTASSERPWNNGPDLGPYPSVKSSVRRLSYWQRRETGFGNRRRCRGEQSESGALAEAILAGRLCRPGKRYQPNREITHNFAGSDPGGGAEDHAGEADKATHWSTRTMAKACAISEKSVWRIWHKHGLKPHPVHILRLATIVTSLRNWRPSSASISIRRNTPLFFVPTRRARSRRWTGLSRGATRERALWNDDPR